LEKKSLVAVCLVCLVIASLVGFSILIRRALIKRSFPQKFSEFRARYEEKRTQGYNLSEAEYWVKKALEAYSRKDYESAIVFLDKALESLEKAEKIPLPSFDVVRSNSWMTDEVTIHDFVPFGVAIERLPDNRIVLPRHQGWTASNFVVFGMCFNENNTLIFHCSVNIGGGFLRLVFNGKRMFERIEGPSYYDDGGKFFPYPTVYTNPEEDYVIAIAYDERTRTWYHKVVYTKTSPPKEILYVEGRGRLTPLWVGKPGGPFVVHGIAGIKAGQLCLDTWGGYLDFEELTRCTYHDLTAEKTYNFSTGFTFMDREYHRNLPIGPIRVEGGKVVDGVEFDAMSFHKLEGEQIEFIFILAKNPLLEELKSKFSFPEFERIGRINFVSRGESYRFDEYEFSTDGKLQPDFYYLVGNFTDETGNVVGRVNLTARAFAFWGKGGAEDWHRHKVWWDTDGIAAWGRSFVKWEGTITIGNQTIVVEEVPGFGEFYRYVRGNSSLGNSEGEISQVYQCLKGRDHDPTAGGKLKFAFYQRSLMVHFDHKLELRAHHLIIGKLEPGAVD